MKFASRFLVTAGLAAGLVLPLHPGAFGAMPQHPQPAGAAPSQEAAASPIPNFFRVNEKVCTAGQPSDAAIEELARTGTKSIINLRRPGESVDPVAEGERVQKLGLRYFNIPLDAKAIGDAQVEEFMRIVGDPENAPMLIHCAAANRVGGLWLIYRVLKEGWSIEKAEAEAKSVGLRSEELRQFALDFIARSRQPKP